MTAILKTISILVTVSLGIGLLLYSLYWLPMWVFACPIEDVVLSLPTGSKEKFTVLVARLEHDRQEEQTVFLRQAFQTLDGMEHMETINTCKRLRIVDNPEHQQQRAKQAQQWLRHHHAELLVYGQDQHNSISHRLCQP